MGGFRFSMLNNKTIVLGVTGSIAAYKIANLASMLVKLNANVHVIMTKNACNFITPITFETITGNKCLVDTFDRNFEFNVEHVALAKRADLFLVAPASANIIGKIASGICDDMLTTSGRTLSYRTTSRNLSTMAIKSYSQHQADWLVAIPVAGNFHQKRLFFSIFCSLWLMRRIWKASVCLSRQVLRRNLSILFATSPIILLARWAMPLQRWRL